MVLVVTANEENASNKKLVALFVFHIRGKQDLQKRVSHKNKSTLLKHKNVRMVIYCMIRVQNCELTFERNKICFYGKTQILLSQKKFTLSTFIMQYATLCHIINISKLAFVMRH